MATEVERTLTLQQLLDVAIGAAADLPVVNFYALKVLLFTMLKSTQLNNVTTAFKDETSVKDLARQRPKTSPSLQPKLDVETIYTSLSAPADMRTARKEVADKRKPTAPDSEKAALSSSGSISKRTSSTDGKPTELRDKEKISTLEYKVSQIETQLQEWAEFTESNEELFDRVKKVHSLDSGRSAYGYDLETTQKPIPEFWKQLHTRNRVAANEAGITKLMSLMQEMMEKMTDANKAISDLNETSVAHETKFHEIHSCLASLTRTNDIIKDMIKNYFIMSSDKLSETEKKSLIDKLADEQSLPVATEDKDRVEEGKEQIPGTDERLGEQDRKIQQTGIKTSKKKSTDETKDKEDQTTEKLIETAGRKDTDEAKFNQMEFSKQFTTRVDRIESKQDEMKTKVDGVISVLERVMNLNVLEDQASKQLLEQLHQLKSHLHTDGSTPDKEILEDQENENKRRSDTSITNDVDKTPSEEDRIGPKPTSSRESVQTKSSVEKTNKLIDQFQQRLEKLERKLQFTIDKIKSTERTKDNASETAVISETKELISKLQTEICNINAKFETQLQEQQTKQATVDSMYEYMLKLQETKADKELLKNEIKVKADKHQLDQKVSRAWAEQHISELSQSTDDVLNKLLEHEKEWELALNNLIEKLGSKISEDDIKPLREYIEKGPPKPKKKVAPQIIHEDVDGDHAAGTKKQLLKCISCDKKVYTKNEELPLLSFDALRVVPSLRPYTTYELEQIRQCLRSGQISKDTIRLEQTLSEMPKGTCPSCKCSVFGLHASSDNAQCLNGQGSGISPIRSYPSRERQAGGQQTQHLTGRLGRSTQRSASPVYSTTSNRVDLIGIDGQVYKGDLLDVSMLPPINRSIKSNPDASIDFQVEAEVNASALSTSPETVS